MTHARDDEADSNDRSGARDPKGPINDPELPIELWLDGFAGAVHRLRDIDSAIAERFVAMLTTEHADIHVGDGWKIRECLVAEARALALRRPEYRVQLLAHVDRLLPLRDRR